MMEGNVGQASPGDIGTNVSLDPKLPTVIPTASAANTMGVLSKLARSYTDKVVKRKMMEELVKHKVGTYKMECQI